ncbi:MAG: hypothetical protein JWP15_1604 [Alphaproteobacteria bacterium]|nr:hypothetical protein [Alphaproteobacteria bacterium]
MKPEYLPPPGLVAIRGLCPRCGARTLFGGLVAFAPRCRSCGLDFSAFNVGDGPAALLILVIGAVITGLAIALELGAHPPFWVHILLWLPLTTLAVIGSLRVAKALLLALEYRHEAAEGRITDEP